MNDPTRPAGSPGPSSPPDTKVPGLPAELAHLFRHSLRDSRIHPLMPLLQHYRQAALDADKPEGEAP